MLCSTIFLLKITLLTFHSLHDGFDFVVVSAIAFPCIFWVWVKFDGILQLKEIDFVVVVLTLED
jgi:hypothetical protein